MNVNLSARAQSTPSSVRLLPSLLAGLTAGLAGGLLATIAWLLLGAPAGPAEAPLGVGPILIASLILNLIGGGVFYALARWTARPAFIFVVLGLVFATLYSAMVLLNPAFASFAWAAAAMHYVAASVAVLLVPRLAIRLSTART